jgi:voltage-dependent potassium channel beta subunit
MKMQYRRLGQAGIRVSVLSLGSWVTFGNQVNLDASLELLDAARSAGVNFFDNAEAYAQGESERLMGRALAELGWPRESYLVSTKFYWGLSRAVNARNTLNRKYLLEAMDKSLERFGLDAIDLIFCHRPDRETPIEETVWAMSDIVTSGQAHYWGTSEWSADEIRAAIEIAERHHLHKPVMEQPEYNLLHRDRVEHEYARLFVDHKLGATIWSPLASGLLTGKYLEGIPQDSRGALPGYEWLQERLSDERELQRVRNLQPIAQDLGCTMAQLAIAWCAANPNVSTVITGASRASQVHENLAALEVLQQLDAEVLGRIEEAVA